MTDEWAPMVAFIKGVLQIESGPITFNDDEVLDVYLLPARGVIADWLVEFRTPADDLFRVVVEHEDRGRAAHLAWEILEQSNENIGDPLALMVRMREIRRTRSA
jgi:hypothetical protein